MNTSRAITEPLHKLQRTHERINRTVKALTASVRHLFRPTAPELPGPLELLIRKETECWDQPHVFGSGSVVEDEAIAEIADAGLVRAFSSLDDYVSGIEAELDRAGLGVSAGGTAANRSPDDDEDVGCRVTRFVASRGLVDSEIEQLLTLHRVFRTMRNCVAHRDSRVSPSLEAQARDRVFIDEMENWPTRSGDPPPHLHIGAAGTRLTLHPSHAILASAVGLRLTTAIDRKAVVQLSEIGVVRMAAYHALLRDPPVMQLEGANTPQAVVSRALAQRYAVTDIDSQRTLEWLKKADCWNSCRDRFSELTG